MAKTIVGLFDSAREAQRAVLELVDGGVSRDDIGVTSRDYSTGGGTGYGNESSYKSDADEGVGDKISNFFSSLFGGDASEDASYYSEAVSRGGTVVTVDAETDEIADRATEIMNRFDADVNERGAAYQETGYTGAQGRVADHTNLEEGGEARIPVMEEQLNVGKREVERGGVHVRSRVVERPVEEAVRLREERVKVERRPVNRAVTDADLQAFREGTIEVRERGEEAVVSKQARVVEEVVVNKEVGERTETVSDTVRRTDVDVDETGGRAKGASASYQQDTIKDKRQS